MSERYGPCFRCQGSAKVLKENEVRECPRCEGTGYEGSALAYEQMIAKVDREEDLERIRKSIRRMT
jgi:DnaJ-class molecular chaperone